MPSLSGSIVWLLAAAAAGAPDGAARGVPILYSTDLHHPHVDPDDHFDLATLFALPEFDIRGIVLDSGSRQMKQPGHVPLRQMMHLAGRNVPFAIGLGRPLSSLEDDGRGQPEEFQHGVALILDVLRRTNQEITVFTTGSVRDMAAALNRQPELFRRKVRCFYLVAGSYNTRLDKKAFARIMTADLPVHWCIGTFAWRGKTVSAFCTNWVFRQRDVLESAPGPLQNYFIYALTQKPPRVDPIAFLSLSTDRSARFEVWDQKGGWYWDHKHQDHQTGGCRDMWCTAPLFHAAGRRIVEVSPGRWTPVPDVPAAQRQVKLYDFVKVHVAVDENGHTTPNFTETTSDNTLIDFNLPGPKHGVLMFKLLDEANFDKIMTSCLRELFAAMPVADGLGVRARPAEGVAVEQTD